MINHYDWHITHLDVMDISIVLFNISSKFLLYLECYILSPKIPKKVIKIHKKVIKIHKKVIKSQ